MPELFEWDEANIEHIASHQVEPREAEEVILNRPLSLGHETREGEIRLRQLGVTSQGRVLIVVSTMAGPRIRVITAHDASRRLRAYHQSIRR